MISPAQLNIQLNPETSTPRETGIKKISTERNMKKFDFVCCSSIELKVMNGLKKISCPSLMCLVLFSVLVSQL